jgi:hypothetical protein
MHRDKPQLSGNDVADADARHATREAVVRRACEVMGWEYKTSPVYAGIRQVALGNAVAISVEKLHAILDRISPRPELCEHGIADGDYCESCNREYKRAAMENNQ